MSVYSKSKDIQISLTDRRFSTSNVVVLMMDGVDVAHSDVDTSLFTVSSPNLTLHLQGLDTGEPGVRFCQLVVSGDVWYEFALLTQGLCVAGTNSYVSLMDSNLYHALRLRPKWLSLDSEKRESLLVSACTIIDSRKWVGYKTDSAQPLEWPRIIDSDSITPNSIKEAQYELAYSMMNGFEPSLPVSNLRLGNFSVSGSSKARTDLPDHVFKLINQYIDYSVKLVR